MSMLPRFEAIPAPRSLALIRPSRMPSLRSSASKTTGCRSNARRKERSAWTLPREHLPATATLRSFTSPQLVAYAPSGACLRSEYRIFSARRIDAQPGCRRCVARAVRETDQGAVDGFRASAPLFVVELLSASDSLAEPSRTERWIENGAQLGWLIDPYRQQVLIFQPGSEPRVFSAEKLDGCGPVHGFSLELPKVWRCYEVSPE